MALILALVAIALAAVSGLFGQRRAAAAMVASGVAGVATGVVALSAGAAMPAWPWSVPGGELSFRIDAIAAMFLIQIFAIAALGAIYGLRYWPDAEHPEDGRKLRVFYGLITAGMALVVIARNGVLFLVGWEVMALSAFFLVSTEDHLPNVRRAGLVYLVATRIGTLCLFAFFALLRSSTGSFSFDAVSLDPNSPAVSAMFVLGVIGFGLKAGAMPLHVWLPDAHANAPTHVSALMSGVLIKMGIYGLVRFLTLFALPPSWWGAVLLAAGITSAVLGVVFAIGQHDLKRLLAYHSVENIGIILMGVGVGVLGKARGNDGIFVLGIAGALLHVWNHGIFKALLFLSAGSVLHATGTRDIDRLGGLAKPMPYTAGMFALGAVAICGLPPLNGFVSELLIYLALVRSCADSSNALFAAGAVGAPALALVGALAVACFVKVYGAVFLGTARAKLAHVPHESAPPMLGAMFVLAACCVVIGLAPVAVRPVLDRAVASFAPSSPELLKLAPLSTVSIAALVLVLAMGLLFAWARRRETLAEVGTWDCGYAAPNARMQYTSSSFAALVVGLFAPVLRPERHTPKVVGLFPSTTRFQSHVPDVVLDKAITPSIRVLERALTSFRWIQHGSVHVYIVYIFAALVLSLLVWR